MIPVCSQIHTTQMNKVWAERKIVTVKPGGKYRNHCIAKGSCATVEKGAPKSTSIVYSTGCPIRKTGGGSLSHFAASVRKVSSLPTL